MFRWFYNRISYCYEQKPRDRGPRICRQTFQRDPHPSDILALRGNARGLPGAATTYAFLGI
jgi:hypothetical protein